MLRTFAVTKTRKFSGGELIQAYYIQNYYWFLDFDLVRNSNVYSWIWQFRFLKHSYHSWPVYRLKSFENQKFCAMMNILVAIVCLCHRHIYLVVVIVEQKFVNENKATYNFQRFIFIKILTGIALCSWHLLMKEYFK